MMTGLFVFFLQSLNLTPRRRFGRLKAKIDSVWKTYMDHHQSLENFKSARGFIGILSLSV